MDLDGRINDSKVMIRNILSVARTPFVQFTGGNESLVVLHLLRSLTEKNVSVLFIDTSVHFPEVYKFVEKIRKLWRLNLVTESNSEMLGEISPGDDRTECCYRLKTRALERAVKRYGIDYLFTGSRKGEKKTVNGQEWSYEDSSFIEVTPVADYSEEDIRNYIRRENLPYCSLYDKGYKKIGCIPCAETSETPPETARGEDPEIMMRLKQLGYV